MTLNRQLPIVQTRVFISIYYLPLGSCYSAILIAISNCSNISNRSPTCSLPACCHPVSRSAVIGITFVQGQPTSLPAPPSPTHDGLKPGLMLLHLKESVETSHITSWPEEMALNQSEGFCESSTTQHLRGHLCQIHVHKTRKPAFRVDLASFYLVQLDGQNKLKCSRTRRYLTGNIQQLIIFR